ncbi:MAG: Rho termination factor N-terminal domain-containing protein [Desulfosarcinaceae bacterium]
MAADKKEAKEKPLDKMTVKELREIAKEIPDITGVHGMNKGDLLAAIKEVRGIKETPRKKAASVRDIKAKIKELKAKRQEALEAKEKKQATILRRKISRLKKKSRQAA